MHRFKPLRSSPPYRRGSKEHIEPSDASSVDTISIELRELSDEELELLDTVVQRAGPSATTFLTVFKAYSEVLTDRGLDPHEVVYYSKLLKLGTMKGRNWGEKWERVKMQWQKTKNPTEQVRVGPVHYEAETVSDLATSFSNRTVSPTPRFAGMTAVRKEPATKKAVRFPMSVAPIETAPDDGRSISRFRPVPLNSSHPKRASSPVSKPKEEQARDIVARAKGRKGAALNDVDAWKNIQMQHDEENADLFRQDKLVERCWQIWLQGYQWIITTTEQVGGARDQLLVQRFIEKWKKKFLVHQQLYQHINDLSNRRVLLTFIRHWQTKSLEARQKKWRQDMRNKMKVVRQHHEARLVKAYWSKWRTMAQSRAVYQSYLNRLVIRTYVGWKVQMAKITQLNTTADNFQNGRSFLVTTYWRKWRRTISYQSTEVTVRRRVDLRILDDAFRKWRNHLHASIVAERFYQQSLKARLTKLWLHRLAHVHRLEKRADKHVAKSDSLLLYAVVRIWKAYQNGRLLERGRSKEVKTFAWTQWRAKINSRRADMARAEEFYLRAASSLAIKAIHQWRKAILETQSREQLADAFHMSHLAIISVHQWRTRLRKKIKMVKIARAASQYFQMRRAWFRWVEMVEAKRREQLAQLFSVNLKRRKFAVWLQKTRLERERNQAVREMQDRITLRRMRESLARWTDRVIALKSRELDIVQQSNMVVLVTAFQKFRTRYLQHVEIQNLLESFMYLKQKDNLRRTFYRWLTAARFSRHRRVVLREKENEIRLRVLEAAWDRWREKSLGPREDEILLQCQRNILCRVFSKWNGKTKAPPAIRFDSMRVKNNFFKRWRGAACQGNKLKEASRLDRQWVAAHFFEKWLEAYRTKKTLKAVARARHLRLPAPSTKKPVISVQTSAFSKRSDFLRPPSPRDEDDDSDAGSVASGVPPARAPSATSSTYIGGKSRATSILSSASRFSFPKAREASPTRALRVPPVVSRARSETRSSPPPSTKKGPSSAASEDPPRRPWPDLKRGTRPFFQPD